jgi:hypothetical protein
MQSPLPVFGEARTKRSCRWPRVWLTLFGANIAFLLLYAWRLGAFLPTLAWDLAATGAVILFFACVASSVTLLFQRRWRLGAALAVASIALAVATIAAVPRLCLAAARRDVGEKARQWAVHLMEMPPSEVLNPVAPDGMEPHVKDALVPPYLMRGYFLGARLERPYSPGGEPYVNVAYGGGRLGASGYYLGVKTLDIPVGGMDDVRKVMPGVYSFSTLE